MTAKFKLLLGVALAAVLALPIVSAGAAGRAQNSSKEALEFHSVVPLGEEPLIAQPAGKFFAIFASAESPEFDGVRLIGDGPKAELVRPDGTPFQRFPAHLEFRVTATSRVDSNTTGDTPYPVNAGDLESLLLRLQFRLKIFDGLHAASYNPVAVKMIGVPDDVPYNERVYRVAFEIGSVPTDRRMLLEVLTPQGERICKFHLDLP